MTSTPYHWDIQLILHIFLECRPSMQPLHSQSLLLADATVEELVSTLLRKAESVQVGSRRSHKRDKHKILASVEHDLERSLFLIRHACDFRAPIYRLPPEVIVQIFLDSEQRNGWSATTVMSVCRQWRAVFLSFPCLWSTIHIQSNKMSPEYLAMALGRSREAPLDVCMDLDYETWQAKPSRLRDLLEVLAVHISRIRHIEISLIAALGSPIAEMLEEVLSTPAPRLETMVVSVVNGFPSLFASTYPRLSHLTLARSHWPLEISRTLTSVKLNCLELDINKLSASILNSPNLDKIELSLVAGLLPQTTQTQHISLDRISLVLHHTDPEVLQYFSLSPSVSLKVLSTHTRHAVLGQSVHCRNTLPTDFSRLKMIQNVEKIDLITAPVNATGNPVVRLIGSAPGAEPFELACVYWRFQLTREHLQLGQVIYNLEPLSVTSVRELSLTGFNQGLRFGQLDWVRLLTSMDALESIVTRTCDNQGLVDALTFEGTFVAISNILCPSLTTMRLLGGTEPDQAQFYASLRKFAKVRARFGCRLRLLELGLRSTAKAIDVEEVEVLRRLVDQFEVNIAWASSSSKIVDGIGI